MDQTGETGYLLTVRGVSSDLLVGRVREVPPVDLRPDWTFTV